MKKRTFTHLILVLLVANTSTASLVCGKSDQSSNSNKSSSFSVDVNIPSFDEKTIQSALISSVGFVASSVALALIYKGAVAHGTTQPVDASIQKLNAPTLFGYGFPLLAAGVLTILHPQVINYLNS